MGMRQAGPQTSLEAVAESAQSIFGKRTPVIQPSARHCTDICTVSLQKLDTFMSVFPWYSLDFITL